MKYRGKLEDTRNTYGKALIELGEKDERVVVIEADLMKASGSEPFKERFPDRHFNVGIAEQNLMSVAAGFACMGKIPFASGFASFVCQRGCDQLINATCFNEFNVKIVGTYAGLTNAKNGGTHIGVEGIAILRAMPNMTILAPADCVELTEAVRVSARHDGPVFIRVARGPMPRIFDDDYKLSLGQAVTLRAGNEITLITTGITTWEGLCAGEELAGKGIDVRHLHMPSIKPIDAEAIIEAAQATKAIFTIENHSRLGGLGSAVAEIVCESCPVPVIRLGMDDCFGETATLEYLMDIHGISASRILEAVEAYLEKVVTV